MSNQINTPKDAAVPGGNDGIGRESRRVGVKTDIKRFWDGNYQICDCVI